MGSRAQYVMLLTSAGQGRCKPEMLRQACSARDRGSNATASLVGASVCVADDVDFIPRNGVPILVCMPCSSKQGAASMALSQMLI